ncbi:uncharacterized protein RCO7_07953 [Rhynchosporium graminicola]|uniref:Uncharacterized protein n=1 Tax=Rhynchosporium graminicola TaxID=2792576 RepID=A0A1E1KNS9_9HELO|nr:uncharacterized protein RCO7_07953 [Rhynchosporium commune]
MKDCLSKDCAIAEASNAQLLLEQICRLIKGITTPPVLSPSTPIIATPSTLAASPTSNIEPSPRQTGNYTARNSQTTKVPLTTLIATPSEKTKKIDNSRITQSTPVPAFTLRHTESTIISDRASSTSVSVILSSAPMTALQTSHISPLLSSSVSPTPTTLTFGTSSAQADLSTSTPQNSGTSGNAIDGTFSAVPTATSAMISYQAEADQSQSNASPMSEVATSHDWPLVVVVVITISVLVLVALFTFNFTLIRRRKLLLEMKHATSPVGAMTEMSGQDITLFLAPPEQETNEHMQKNEGLSNKKIEAVRGKRVWKGPKSTISVGEKEHELKFSFDFRSGLNMHPPKL